MSECALLLARHRCYVSCTIHTISHVLVYESVCVCVCVLKRSLIRVYVLWVSWDRVSVCGSLFSFCLAHWLRYTSSSPLILLRFLVIQICVCTFGCRRRWCKCLRAMQSCVGPLHVRIFTKCAWIIQFECFAFDKSPRAYNLCTEQKLPMPESGNGN